MNCGEPLSLVSAIATPLEGDGNQKLPDTVAYAHHLQ